MAALGLDDDSRIVEAARSEVFNSACVPVVSLAALGELALVTATDERFEVDKIESARSRLANMFRAKRLTSFGLGHAGEVFAHATALQTADDHLSPADALILASMVADDEADVLLTMDTFATWPSVRSYVSKHEKHVRTLDASSSPKPGGNRRSRGKRP